MTFIDYTYTYTSQDEVDRLISSSGASGWLDDLSNVDVATYYNEIVQDATGTVNQYLEKLYNPIDMQNSPWVRRRATYIAAYHLTKRRGDPGLYGEDYDRVLDELQMASEGIIQIPGLAYSSGMLAVMQNVLVDQRFARNKNRVVSEISTDVTGSQNLSYGMPWVWL
jgi:phage gp36-like protein